MPPHRIHLKGPWEYQWLPDMPGNHRQETHTTTAAPAGPTDTRRITMPADWQSLFGNTSGRAAFRRRFHRPTRLDEYERVELVFDAVGGSGHVALNGVEVGRILPSAQPQRFDITRLLQPFNELRVDLQYDGADDAPPGGLYAPVALEIVTVLSNGVITDEQ